MPGSVRSKPASDKLQCIFREIVDELVPQLRDPEGQAAQRSLERKNLDLIRAIDRHSQTL